MPDTIQVRDMPLHDGAASAEEMADGVIYPVCDKMGESSLQQFVNMWLVLLLRSYFAAEGRPAFVGSNQFFYYKRGDPRSAVSPDLYVIDGEERSPTSVPSWKVWEHDGKVPALAVEVMSDEYRKDYAEQLLERYQQLGVRELIRYDPGHAGRSGRSLLTHFVRDEGGRLIARPTLHDRVQSVVFGVWFVIQADRTIRLGVGPHGEALWPTADERAAAEARARQDAEAAQGLEAAARKAEAAAREAADAAREAADAARAVAEAEVERLRAELARLRGV